MVMQQAVKDLIVDQVRSFLNDRAKGERPVARRDDGLFGPGSVAWKVHGDVTTMMVGGTAALLLQMLHPSVLAGVWDHSNFRNDMLGRLRRTARFIALTTYGSEQEASEAIARVKDVHRHVSGTLPNGEPYSADDPALLTWVHVTETYCFLEAWKRYAEPGLATVDHDRYVAEMSEVARRLGAVDLPSNWRETLLYMASMRTELEASDRTREVVGLLLNPAMGGIALPRLQQMTSQAAVDLLPRWARRMHGLRASTLTRPMVHGGTAGVAGLLRWAFR
jgi:uncharacterized protein (DUF2236 family)